MPYTCPACARAIPVEDINVQTDLALCKSCGETTRFSQLATAGDTASHDDLRTPPPGAWYRENLRETVVGATTRHPIAFFLVPFMCVWSGGSIGGIYGTQIARGEFSLFQSLFGIPFLLGSLLFWSIALMAIWGKVELRLNGRRGVIFVGIGALGWKRALDLDAYDTITEERWPMNYPGHRGAGIVLEGRRRLRFGTNLSEDRRLFIFKALRALKARRN